MRFPANQIPAPKAAFASRDLEALSDVGAAIDNIVSAGPTVLEEDPAICEVNKGTSCPLHRQGC
jgi:hypothetical protein